MSTQLRETSEIVRNRMSEMMDTYELLLIEQIEKANSAFSKSD